MMCHELEVIEMAFLHDPGKGLIRMAEKTGEENAI